MSNNKAEIAKFVKKTNSAIQYLMGVLNNQNELFTVDYSSFYSSYLKEDLKKSFENIEDYIFILQNKRVLVESDKNRPSVMRVRYDALADLIIKCSRLSKQKTFNQLPGLSKLIQNEDIPNELKEFFENYQSLNLKGYNLRQFTNTERN
jgi:Ran GTPase-activating protein (RanGAP) involved in mRNA processing and transport